MGRWICGRWICVWGAPFFSPDAPNPLFWRVSERFGAKIWGAPNADPTTTDPTELPEGPDVHDPKGFPKTSVRKALGLHFCNCVPYLRDERAIAKTASARPRREQLNHSSFRTNFPGNQLESHTDLDILMQISSPGHQESVSDRNQKSLLRGISKHQRFREWSWRSFRRNWWRTSGEVWKEIFELLKNSFAGKIVSSIFHQNSTANFTIKLHYEVLGCGGPYISCSRMMCFGLPWEAAGLGNWPKRENSQKCLGEGAKGLLDPGSKGLRKVFCTTQNPFCTGAKEALGGAKDFSETFAPWVQKTFCTLP